MIAKDVDIPGIVRQAQPAVAQIVALDDQNKTLKTGTGFFISADGNLLTNYHVISDARSILAKTASGAVYSFKKIVAFSPKPDVALLTFYATDVPYLNLGSTADAVEGQRVLVLGNPEGFEGTVSDGIISAFHRFINDGVVYESIEERTEALEYSGRHHQAHCLFEIAYKDRNPPSILALSLKVLK